MITEPFQWICAVLGALMVGISKAGITGLSLLSIALLLIFGDIVAVLSYRTHTQWRFLWKLLPWTAAGVVLGYFTLSHISDKTVRIMIGAIIVSLCVLGYWRRYLSVQTQGTPAGWHWSLAAALGVIAGFITL